MESEGSRATAATTSVSRTRMAVTVFNAMLWLSRAPWYVSSRDLGKSWVAAVDGRDQGEEGAELAVRAIHFCI